METMKAIIQEHYGDTSQLRVAQVAIPQVQSGEVLVKVIATSLNAPDWRLLRGSPFFVRMSSGLFKPKHVVKGTDISGIVVELGPGANRFKIGDVVMADLATSGFGAFADYVSVKEEVLARKPQRLSHLEAATLPLASVTALQAIRNVGQVQAGEHVLIVGASGGVGSYALQLAKYFGAAVTAVTGSNHVEQAKNFGADRVIDYSRTPLESLTGNYDAIIAINGYNRLATYQKLLSPQGRFVMVGGKSMSQILQVSAFGKLLSKKNGPTFQALLARPNAVDLAFIANLVDEYKISPVIAREVPFNQIPKALAVLEKGHTGGKIVAWVNEL